MREAGGMNKLKPLILSLLRVMGIALSLSSCVSVDTVRLTNQQFPAKASVGEVEILDRKPSCDHVVIARLSVDDSEYDSFQGEQEKILKKAAALGADAVIFSKPQKSVRQGVTNSGMGCMACGPYGYGMYGYPGWGYGSGYGYGMGWGYGGMAVPYNYTVKSLRGVAIHFTNSSDKQTC